MKINENLYWYSKDKPITGFLGRGMSGNVFLLNQGDELWFIDVGVKYLGRPKRIIKWMRKDGLIPEKVSKVFLTHAHSDHAGAAGFFKDKFNCDVYIHELGLQYLEHGWDLIWREQEEVSRGLLREFYPIPLCLVKKLVHYSIGDIPQFDALTMKDGEIFKGNNFTLEVIHTPGHVSDHCCFYIPENGCVFLGDLIDPSFDHKASLNFPNSDFKQIYDSIKRIMALNGEIFCATHAKKVHVGQETCWEICQGTLDILDQALETTITLLKQSNGMKLKEFKGHYPKETWTWQDQICVPYTIINYLERQGKIRFENEKFYYIDD